MFVLYQFEINYITGIKCISKTGEETTYADKTYAGGNLSAL